MSDVSAILDALTVPSLKDILSVLTGKDVSGRNSKAELIAKIHESGRPSEVNKLANRLETVLPRRHTWLFTISSPPKSLDKDGVRKLVAAFQGLVAQSNDTNNNPQAIVPVDFVEDTIRGRLYLKFIHHVKSINWEFVTKTQKELRETNIRHAVVAVVRVNDGIVEIRFNGYKQGLATPHHERLAYLTLVREAKQIVEKSTGAYLFGLHLHEAASELLANSDDVVATRVVIRPSEGGQIVLDTGEGSSARDIPELIQQTFGTSGNVAEIRQALRDSPTDSLLLMWTKYQVLTRLAFSDLGTELLYIWRFADKSEDVLDNILGEILKKYKRKNVEQSAIRKYVEQAAEGQVFLTSYVCQRFQIAPEEAIKEFEQLVVENQVHRCFRIRTAKTLHDYPNHWISSLADLPERLEDEDGVVFTSLDPSAIEFGYRK